MNAKAWKDSAGRAYRIDLTPDLVDRVRLDLGLDLANVLTGKLAGVFLARPEALAQILYTISVPVRGTVEPEIFAASLDNDSLESASRAMIEAVSEFYLQPRTAEAIRKEMARHSRSK